MVHVESACATPATVLRAKFTELRDKLENNQFEKPLYLDSSENGGESKGNLYALIQTPFPMVQSALKEPARWCDILILHLNTKYCRASAEGAWTVLKVNIGKKYEQPIAQSYRMEFSYRGIVATPDHFAVVLDATKGPFGTRNYSILLEATPDGVDAAEVILSHPGAAHAPGAREDDLRSLEAQKYNERSCIP